MLDWILAALAGLIVLGLLVWWLVFKTEGIYLGRGVVVGLYDLYASRYDAIKQYEPYGEEMYLAVPILQRLWEVRAPLVLDVATGTGRLPLALLEQPSFQGRVVALDLSRRMLAQAAPKLAPYGDRAVLMHTPAEELPFPDDTFDLVTCLEALEFTMQPRAVLRELVRVLRHGGLLVLTNRQGLDARLMPGRTFAHAALEAYLRDDLGLTGVSVEPWQVDYRIVWAVKAGRSRVTGPRPLGEIWNCPRCGALALAPDADGWRCAACGAHVPVGADGVIEVVKARK